MSVRRASIVLLATTVALIEGEAFAQDASASGTVTAQGAAVATSPAPVAKGIAEDGTADHEKVVGHFAVGYLGTAVIPFPAVGGQPAGLSAPVIGGRYWLNRQMGIDAGLGLAFIAGATEAPAGTGTTTTDKPTRFGVLLHGGVPFALATGKHFTFEAIPELNIGLATATTKGTGGAPDTSHSGFRLDLGARVGAEIQFGFINIPQLALQGSVGLYISRASSSSTAGGSTTSDGTTSILTTVQNDPWALFTNSISALYYF